MRAMRIEWNAIDILCTAAALLVALGVKQFYSTAGSDELRFITAPTALCVQAVTGIRFGYEHGTGYLSADSGTLIAPACAGLNFAIIAFCAIVFTQVRRVRRPAGKLLLVAIAAVTAYFLTVGVNTVRIAAAIALYKAEIHAGWLTAQRLHRIEGIVVYLAGLALAQWLAARIAGRLSGDTCGGLPASLTPAIPLLAYLGLTVIMPVLRGSAFSRGTLFAEHCLFVCGIPLIAVLFFVIGRILFARHPRISGKTGSVPA